MCRIEAQVEQINFDDMSASPGRTRKKLFDTNVVDAYPLNIERGSLNPMLSCRVYCVKLSGLSEISVIIVS